jgi:hypothetical protein
MELTVNITAHWTTPAKRVSPNWALHVCDLAHPHIALNFAAAFPIFRSSNAIQQRSEGKGGATAVILFCRALWSQKMSRLMSKLKLGYYPLPVEEARNIRALLVPSGQYRRH